MISLGAPMGQRPEQVTLIYKLITQPPLELIERRFIRHFQVRALGWVSTIKSSNTTTPSRIQNKGKRCS